MGKFLVGFALGAAVGVGMALLLAPEAGERSRLRLQDATDRLAAGDETALGSVSGLLSDQRNRFQEAVAAGRRANAERQAELLAALNLRPPDEGPGQTLT